ncbi:MAG: selenocysteine-specific translation elongation factor [Candidatus Brocadiales bacterium]|nr:selenocysteine-specific translation elongation factor [Candidatus Bathyanammoxibius amoris]
MKKVVIGTAGHIDHGKTALIIALTGIDTDRLPEEKARGITIDLGFAYMDIDKDLRAGIVDVPGHERFVKNMLAGATGINLVVLVIAADDGVMPQTVEHLEILELLGIKHGVLVITKKDLVDKDWLELVKGDVKALVSKTFLRDAPMRVVSSVTGEGIPELRETLKELILSLQEEQLHGVFRIPVDRAFTIQGFGCVVTGTVSSGEVRVGDEVEILPTKETARVRGIEVHEEKTGFAHRGQRAALNLSGVKTSEIHRGYQLSVPGYLEPVRMVDGYLNYLTTARKPLGNGERIRFHIATSEVMGRAVLLDKEVLKPGENAFVQYRLEEPVVAERGEHYVIRSYSPCRTIGGGEVLRSTHTRKLRRLKEETLAPLRLLHEGTEKEIIEKTFLEPGRYLLSDEEISRLLNIFLPRTREIINELTEKGILVNMKENSRAFSIHKQTLSATRAEILKRLEEYHRANPMKRGAEDAALRTRMPKDMPGQLISRVLADLQKEGAITSSGQRFAITGHRVELSEPDKKTMKSIEDSFLKDKFAPPSLEKISPKNPSERDRFRSLLNILVEEGTLIEVKPGLYFHSKVIDELKKSLEKSIRERGAITVAEFRDLVGTSRKYMVPLLEHFDSIRLTKRVGDKRVLYNT